MNISVADLRQNYTSGELSEENANRDPIKQFQIWFEQAVASEIPEPNAMTLATCTKDGKPSARIVLLKHFDDRGFVFFTNYTSNKGKELENNPQAALVFLWKQLERQVRIQGSVVKISGEESDQYFNSRPEASRLGAWVSQQSQVIPNREVLEDNFAQLQQQYQGKEIPRPNYWGGFRVMPTEIEFWQGRPSRLHDRLRYRQQEDGSWLRERLAP